jgi:anti-sigma regulatory factor (Ser/Thr protein kinase)
MAVGPVLTLDLPRHLGAESIARRELARWFKGRPSEVLVDDLQQVASELVTNAVLHGTGEITLEAHSTRETVSMEICDEGAGFTVLNSSRTGSGLAIVDAVCEQWGVAPGTTHVWCHLGTAIPATGRR